MQNAFIESFNGKPLDECSYGTLFAPLKYTHRVAGKLRTQFMLEETWGALHSVSVGCFVYISEKGFYLTELKYNLRRSFQISRVLKMQKAEIQESSVYKVRIGSRKWILFAYAIVQSIHARAKNRSSFIEQNCI